jgi:hypothetical protein
MEVSSLRCGGEALSIDFYPTHKLNSSKLAQRFPRFAGTFRSNRFPDSATRSSFSPNCRQDRSNAERNGLSMAAGILKLAFGLTKKTGEFKK